MLKIASYSFLVLMILSSCHQTDNNTESNIVMDSIPKKEPITDTLKKTVSKNQVPAVIEEANKLNEEINKNPNDSLFKRLDILACKSDGELTTSIGEIMKNTFDNHFDLIFIYLFNNKQSCLYKALTEGYSEDLSVYEGEERAQKISTLKKENLKKANKLNYSKEQIKYLTQLLDKINPAIFD